MENFWLSVFTAKTKEITRDKMLYRANEHSKEKWVLEARENADDQVAIGFLILNLIGWSFLHQSQVTSRMTFVTQLKTVSIAEAILYALYKAVWTKSCPFK